MKEWQQFLSKLEQELGAELVRRWIPPICRFDAGNIYLEAGDSFQSNWFEEHIRPRLKGFTNSNQRSIKVHLLKEKVNFGSKPSFTAGSKGLQFLSDPIDLEMTLDHFIPVAQSLIAYQLLTETQIPFNPIYLYGPKGVGKTHLLMGSALQLQKKGKKVFFVKAETFTEHVVQAIRLGQMQAFRKVYREIDALIIDDIHMFSRKTATQEEFFHTFNTLHTLGLPILLSASSLPSQLNEIEPRLISRFEWGISLELGKSDIRPILHKKAALWQLTLPDDLMEWIALQFPNHPLLALQALSLRAKDAPLNIAMAEKLLHDLLTKEKATLLTSETIIKKVAAHYGLTSEDLLGKSQMRAVVLPRQIAMYLCREKLQLPFQTIGSIFGRDHSTVISSIKQIQKGIENNQINQLECLVSPP